MDHQHISRLRRATSVLVVVLAAFGLASTAKAQGPTGCGYGSGGVYDTTLCWIDMAGFDRAMAQAPGGQPMSITLPGGYTITFTVTETPVPGLNMPTSVVATALPTWSGAYTGNSVYVGTPGRPALYSGDGPNRGSRITLSNISVTDSAGQPVTGYGFIVADAESTDTTEYIQFDSNVALNEIVDPAAPARCHGGLSGVGSTSVTCTGGPHPGQPNGALILEAISPSTISAAVKDAGRQAIAFAVLTSKIQLTKAVVGRVRSTDSFDISATSPEGTAIGSASTGAADSATTGEMTVLSRTSGSSYSLAEAITAGSGTRLADYAQSWSCTNDGAADPSLPSGTGTSLAVAPQPGDDIECTVTNTQLPADLSVLKTGAPSPMVPGEDLTYTIVVTNNGPSRATATTMSDTLPAGLTFKSASAGCSEAGGTVTCAVGTLDPGASQTFTITAAVASSLDRCHLNRSTVTSATPDTNIDNNTSTVCVPIAARADLRITKTPSATLLPQGGGQVMYTLVVHNTGPSDATNVRVSDPLPSGLTLTHLDPSQGACDPVAGSTVSCNLGRIPVGGSAQVLVTTQTWGTPGAITNTATVSADQTDPDPSDNSFSSTVTVPDTATPPPPAFDLRVTKTAAHRQIGLGGTIAYTIVVENRGPAAAPGVVLTDTYSARATLVSIAPSSGSCVRQLPFTCTLSTIGAGERATVRVVLRPQAAGCQQRNAASATGVGTDSDPTNNLDTVDLCVRRPSLAITKVANRRTVAAGDRVTFTIRVTNRSRSVAAYNVRVCDDMPSGLIYVSSSPTARLSGGRHCWTAATIAAGSSRIYRLTARAVAGARGLKTNVATAAAPGARTIRATRRVRVISSDVFGGGVTG